MNFIKEMIYRLRGEYTTEHLIKRGLQVGSNFNRLNGVILDPSHCWLIEIGNNVTLAPRVHILCHDASTKQFLGKTKIGKVKIGDNVFVGANTTILPNVKIGSNVIIGANSVITNDVEDGTVVVGNPGKVLCSIDDYLKKERQRMDSAPIFDDTYTLNNISEEKKLKQKELLLNKIGYID